MTSAKDVVFPSRKCSWRASLHWPKSIAIGWFMGC